MAEEVSFATDCGEAMLDQRTIQIRKFLGLGNYLGCVACGCNYLRRDLDSVVRCGCCDGEVFNSVNGGVCGYCKGSSNKLFVGSS